MHCEIEPNAKTCDCEPPCGALCCMPGCGRVATVVVSGNLAFGDENDPDADEDWSAWVCTKCAKQMKVVRQ